MEETSIIPIFTRRQMSGICVQVSVDVCTVTAQHSTLFAQWRPLRPWHGAQWHNISASTLSYPATDLCLVNDWHTSTLHLNNNFRIRERFSLFRQQSYREKSFWFYLNLKHCIEDFFSFRIKSFELQNMKYKERCFVSNLWSNRDTQNFVTYNVYINIFSGYLFIFKTNLYVDIKEYFQTYEQILVH